MNILLLGEKVKSKQQINSYSSMQAYFLEYYLNELGVKVFFYSTKNSSTPEIFCEKILKFCEENNIDHIIALGVNFFGKANRKIAYTLSSQFKGMVTQIYDGTTFDDVQIDLNFSIKDESHRFEDNANNRLTRHLSCNYTINWAADNDLFKPRQNQDKTLKVFVDHPTFTDTSLDHSLTVFMNLKRLLSLIKSNKIPNYNDLVVKTLTDNGVEIVDLNDICVKPYNRTPISAEQFANELASSNLFFVTHTESIGLCVLEAAMSGALVFIPSGTINKDLLQKINHIEFSKSINWNDWGQISEKLTPEINSILVQKYNWKNFTLNILEGLIRFKKRDLTHKFPIKQLS